MHQPAQFQAVFVHPESLQTTGDTLSLGVTCPVPAAF